jgi:hypothetical protein
METKLFGPRCILFLLLQTENKSAKATSTLLSTPNLLLFFFSLENFTMSGPAEWLSAKMGLGSLVVLSVSVSFPSPIVSYPVGHRADSHSSQRKPQPYPTPTILRARPGKPRLSVSSQIDPSAFAIAQRKNPTKHTQRQLRVEFSSPIVVQLLAAATCTTHQIRRAAFAGSLTLFL